MRREKGGGRRVPAAFGSYLQVAPLTLVYAVFLVVPLLTLVIVSFFDYDSVQIIPGFVLTNYQDVLFSATTWWTYVSTIRFAFIAWAITLFVGFWVAYYRAFHFPRPAT